MKHFLVTFSLICTILTIQAQKALKFNRYTINDGLSQTIVQCIIQDKHGFMWFGTQDGLNRFDGKTFKIFRSDPKNPENTITSGFIFHLNEDQRGYIWIITQGGISCYNPKSETFTNFKHTPNNSLGLPLPNPYWTMHDQQGDIWILSANSGLTRMRWSGNKADSPVFTVFDKIENDTTKILLSQQPQLIPRIVFDKIGVGWINTNKGVLQLSINKNDVKIKQYTHQLNNPNNNNSSIYDIQFDSKQQMWFSTVEGLKQVLKIENDKLIFRTLPTQVPIAPCLFSFVGHKITIGYLVNNGKLNILDTITGSLIEYAHNPADVNTLNHNNVQSGYLDRNNVLWLGTWQGLCSADMNKNEIGYYTQIPDNANSLSTNIVFSMYQDRDSMLWVGTYQSSLNRINRKDNTVKTYFDNVFFVTGDNNDNIWFHLLGKGLMKYNRKTDAFDTYGLRSGNNGITMDKFLFVYYMAADKKENLWLGILGGSLLRYDIQKDLVWQYQTLITTDKQSVQAGEIWNILSTSEDDIWIGANNGLFKKVSYEADGTPIFKHYKQDKEPNGLSNNAVMCLFQSTDGYIWIGTSGGGLNRFDPKTETFKWYTLSSGLKNAFINAIQQDKQGYLWISTNQGMEKFDTKTETFRNYDVMSGFQSNEFNVGASYMSPSGELFFGGVNGLNAFYPSDVKDNPFAPAVAITDFKIHNQSVAPSTNGILKKSILYTDTIELSYSDNTFAFAFAALHYGVPSKNQYAYMMEGADKEWQYIGNQNFVSYTSFPAGKYTFRVKAANSDGVWNETGRSIYIIIHPPFWQTAWFYTLVIIVLLTAFYMYVKIRERALIRTKEVLEQKVKERTVEIQQQKEEIQAQAELLQETNLELEKLSIVASETNNAVIIMDNEANFEWFNDGFTRLYGYTYDQFVAEKGKNLLLTSKNPQIQELIRECIDEKKSVIYESLNECRNGDVRWAQTTITPIVDADGKVERIIAIDSDISNLKAVQDELAQQRDFANEQTKKITDSIMYARRIQAAVLPQSEMIDSVLPEHFILFRPRDIVSGDFYWVRHTGNRIFFAAVDCTGHGVPGAFMSMLGMAMLNEIALNPQIHTAGQILEDLRNRIKEALHQQGREGENKDGMDMALCIIETDKQIIQFAGAHNPLYIIHPTGSKDFSAWEHDAYKQVSKNNVTLTQIQPDSMPIGIYFKETTFKNHVIPYQSGDRLYVFSDGVVDQIGGENGKKFMAKNFKNFLLDIWQQPMSEQGNIIDNKLKSWISAYTNRTTQYEQIDDILVMGVKL